MMTRGEYARRVIRGIGGHIERGDEAQLALVCWMVGESGHDGRDDAANNPLNCTLWMPGCTSYNWVPVRNYVSPEQGVDAAVQTLQKGTIFGYAPIRRRIRRNKNAERILRAVEASEWGTGGIALDVLADVRAGRQSFKALRAVELRPF